ncbi:MAG: 50S ribosomal protein L24 [Methanocellales archaeon]
MSAAITSGEMKTKSSQPRKQRRARYKAPLHKRKKYLRATLSPSLREKYGKRSAQLRVGDTVKVMRGDRKGHEGKVTAIDLKTEKVIVEGVTIARADGTEKPRPLHPSNLMITKLELKDKTREEILKR